MTKLLLFFFIYIDLVKIPTPAERDLIDSRDNYKVHSSIVGEYRVVTANAHLAP